MKNKKTYNNGKKNGKNVKNGKGAAGVERLKSLGDVLEGLKRSVETIRSNARIAELKDKVFYNIGKLVSHTTIAKQIYTDLLVPGGDVGYYPGFEGEALKLIDETKSAMQECTDLFNEKFNKAEQEDNGSDGLKGIAVEIGEDFADDEVPDCEHCTEDCPLAGTKNAAVRLTVEKPSYKKPELPKRDSKGRFVKRQVKNRTKTAKAKKAQKKSGVAWL